MRSQSLDDIVPTEGVPLTEGTDPARLIIDIVTGTWRSQALRAAVVLGVADHIAAGHDLLDDLADVTGVEAGRLQRLLRLLVSMGIFGQMSDPAGAYHLRPPGELLRQDADNSLRDLVDIYGAEFHMAWAFFDQAVVSGRSGFEIAYGEPLGTYLAKDAALSRRFQRAMRAGSLFFGDVPKVFDFTGCATVTDLAGGSGELLATVLHAFPGVRGILYERPHVTPLAEEFLAQELSADRYEIRSGDIFVEAPPGSDVYLLSRILQDWDDPGCVSLLTVCRQAMTDTSKLLIAERVIPERPAIGDLPVLWDLHLMTAANGQQRTLQGYRMLLEEAGLRLTAVHPMALETSLLVAER